MEFRYIPKGVCATEIVVDLDGDMIKRVEIIDGCVGNSLGIAKLVEGMNVHETISKLNGIKCEFRKTSCPDQLSKALEKATQEDKNESRCIV